MTRHAEEKLGFSGCTVVLSIGGPTEKRLKTPIEACSFMKLHPHIVVIIAGSGEMESELKEQIKREHLGKQVRMVGHKVGEEKLGFLQASDIAVLPSIETAEGDIEGLPVTLTESLAAGLPRIASLQSGGEEVINNQENGFLIPGADPQALADRILRVVANLVSARRDGLRGNARDLASAFDWTHIAREHMAHSFSVTSEADRIR